jgi:hypothetical protein
MAGPPVCWPPGITPGPDNLPSCASAAVVTSATKAALPANLPKNLVISIAFSPRAAAFAPHNCRCDLTRSAMPLSTILAFTCINVHTSVALA